MDSRSPVQLNMGIEHRRLSQRATPGQQRFFFAVFATSLRLCEKVPAKTAKKCVLDGCLTFNHPGLWLNCGQGGGFAATVSQV
jgi:hypothetical protein